MKNIPRKEKYVVNGFILSRNKLIFTGKRKKFFKFIYFTYYFNVSFGWYTENKNKT